MSRRIGQAGNVFQTALTTWDPATPAYGRFWVDTTDGRKRKTIALGVCRTRTVAKQKLREHIAVSGINDVQTFYENTAPALIFRVQANAWLESMRTRRRRPLKPATLLNWQNHLSKWILPHFGDMPLSDVGNTALRSLVDKLAGAALSAKTIQNYSAVVRMVVASAVNEEGEPIYPRKWNPDFIGIPVVSKDSQRRPTIEPEHVPAVIAAVRDRYRVLFALLAVSGLRAGEALGIRDEDLSADCRVLYVRRSVWRGKEQSPKTANGIREVDIPETFARVLRGFVAGKKGYIFTTRGGRPISQRNLLRVLHAVAGKIGFHSFRRFRTSVLRKARVPEDLVRFWLGHAGRSVTDDYARQLREDLPFRQEWAERAGLGFELNAELGCAGLEKVSEVVLQKAA